jgi:hypothetical protein
MLASFGTPGRWEHWLGLRERLPMPSMSKIDLFAAIRRDARAGSSSRATAAGYKVSRRRLWRSRRKRSEIGHHHSRMA